MTNNSDRPNGDGLPLDVRIQTARYAFFRLLRADAPHERLREEWSKLETLLDSPTRDGAEGAANCPHGNPLYVFCAYCQPSAPPKPALDAVQEVLRDALPFVRSTLHGSIQSRGNMAQRVVDALAAPVPSPDGAGELRELAHQLESADWGDAPAPMRVLALKVCRAIHALSPSPAVAADR